MPSAPSRPPANAGGSWTPPGQGEFTREGVSQGAEAGSSGTGVTAEPAGPRSCPGSADSSREGPRSGTSFHIAHVSPACESRHWAHDVLDFFSCPASVFCCLCHHWRSGQTSPLSWLNATGVAWLSLSEAGRCQEPSKGCPVYLLLAGCVTSAPLEAGACPVGRAEGRAEGRGPPCPTCSDTGLPATPALCLPALQPPSKSEPAWNEFSQIQSLKLEGFPPQTHRRASVSWFTARTSRRI